MKYFTKSIIIIICISFASFASAQSVTNIKPTVNGNNIEIQYVVKGLKLNQTLTTSLYVSSDGGITFQGPMLEVTGDVGEKIINGQHLITWEATKEMSLLNVNAIFDIKAEVVTGKIKRNLFVAYSGNLTTPIGLRLGMLGGLAWYITAQSNTQPTLAGTYSYADGIVTDYTRFAWYEFTSQHKVSAYTACAGITKQAGRNLYFYLGAGYGKEDYLYQINEFSYDGDTPLGTDYARDNSISTTGIALEAGLIIKTGKILITGGASSVAFTMPGWQVGLGLSF